ncbi:DNA topoisomerase VI subunit B [Candidatus Thorarchaeota archaeon]|nr:MAG: DNA topoisomerase VI subunit B [Candidatus Thorarchaeota archaeon]
MSGPESTHLDFSSISPSEFFYRNRQMAGFGNPTHATYSTVRELVENSLDACEDVGRRPRVEVSLESTKSNEVIISVKDNGSGLPYDEVPSAFGQVLYGSKYGLRQKRGTFGLGVTMTVLYGQITTDSPVMIHTQHNGRGREYRLHIDIENNCPVVEEDEGRTRNENGTTVAVRIGGDLARALPRIQDYLRLTSIATPHARLILHVDNETILDTGPWVKTLPAQPTISKPHPRSADTELVRRTMVGKEAYSLNEYLIESFQQVGRKTADEVIRFLGYDPKKLVGDLTRNEIARISSVLKSYDSFNRPDSSSLSPIGREPLLGAIDGVYGPEYSFYTRRGPLEWEGHPFIIEGVIASGSAFPKREEPALYRFANRVPLLYDASDDVLTKTLKKVSWSRYGIPNGRHWAIFISFCSTRVPYQAAGKQAISNPAEIESASLALFRELGRAASKMAKKQQRSKKLQRRIREMKTSLEMIARFSANLTGFDAERAEIMAREMFQGDWP